MNEITLNNGLKIYTNELSNTHSIAIDLCIRAGSKYENCEVEGISHFLEHIHFRFLNGYTQDELYYFMESLGTTLQAITYKDFIRFYLKIHPTYFKKSLLIFKAILETYEFPKEEIEKEKAVILNEIFEKDNMDIDDLCQSNYFKGLNLGNKILGTAEKVNNLSSTLISKYKKDFFNINNMALFISGPIKENHIKELNNILGKINIPVGNRFYSNQKPKQFNKRKSDILLVNCDWDSIDIDISFDVDMDKVALYEIDILNCILGGGVGSRLQCLLRENLCFVYEIFSTVEKYEELSILHIKFSVKKQLVYKCFEAIVSVLNEMKTDLNFQDLETTLPFFKENLAFDLDDTQETNFINEWNFFVLNRNDFDCKFDYNEDTLKRLTTISNTLFMPENVSVTCLGGCSTINKEKIENIINNLNI